MDNSDFNYSYQYNNWHCDTDESRNTDIQLAQNLFTIHNLFPKNKMSKVLEIGCGMGRFLQMLKANGFQNLVGVDIDKTQIDIAQKEGLNVYLSDAIEWLKNSNEEFDAIYFFDVLEHIDKEKQLNFLKLVYEHSTDNAKIAFSVPNALAPGAMLYRYIDFTHTTSYTNYTVSFLLKNAGFHYMDIRPQHKESKHVRRLKKVWADIYMQEFGLKDIILTPNLVTVAFKNQEELKVYTKNTPKIVNEYKYESQIQRFWRHLKTLKF